jgi:hypothetical protein
MERNFFNDESTEEVGTSYVVALSLKVLWTFLTLFVLLGVLLALTIILEWSKFVLPCLLGLLTGIAITGGVVTSPRNRALTILLLGVLTLPGFALYLSLMAGRSDQAFQASSAALMPFVVHALAALVGGLIMVKTWRHMPVREGQEEPEKEAPPVSKGGPAAPEKTRTAEGGA